MVEQAIRYSNLEQFESNAMADHEGGEAHGDDFFTGAIQAQARADRAEE